MIILHVNDHEKPPDHSISRYNFDQEISNHWGFPFLWGFVSGRDQFNTRSGPAADSIPDI
jgi:hypothetical protein